MKRNLIFCERDRSWQTGFRQMTRSNFEIAHTTSIKSLQEWSVSKLPAIFLIATESFKFEDQAELLDRVQGSSLLRAVALLSHSRKDWQLDVRAIGYSDVVTSYFEFPRIEKFANRHFELIPENVLSWREEVENSLPW